MIPNIHFYNLALTPSAGLQSFIHQYSKRSNLA